MAYERKRKGNIFEKRRGSRLKNTRTTTPRQVAPSPQRDECVRINRFLAMSGHGSRRAVEELIRDQRVRLNGDVVTDLGTKVNLKTDQVTVDGGKVQKERWLTILMNKPRGVLSAARDRHGMKTVVDVLRGSVDVRLFPIGQLELDSEGLILLTNDGALAQALTHPSYDVPRTYEAVVNAEISLDAIDKLRKGVFLSEGKTKPCWIQVKQRTHNKSILEISITQSLNRQVRRMFAKVGYDIWRLTRVAMGPIKIGKLKPGKWRFLNPEEVKLLREATHKGGPKRAVKNVPAETDEEPGQD